MKATKVLFALLIGSAAIVTASADDVAVAEESAPPLRLLLDVKSVGGNQTWCQGEPISLQVGLIDERFHLKEAGEQAEEGEGSSEVQHVIVGSENWPWFRGIAVQVQRVQKEANGELTTEPVLQQLNWQERIVSPDPAGYVSHETGPHALICVLSLEPQVSKSLAPGQYIVKATWDATNAPAGDTDTWRGKLESEPVEISILPATTEEDKGKLAFALAAYYIRHKDFDAALAEALKVEQLLPSYQLSECYAIAARAYEGKGEIRSAIQYYRKFLDAHKDANVERWHYITLIRNKVDVLEAQLEE